MTVLTTLLCVRLLSLISVVSVSRVSRKIPTGFRFLVPALCTFSQVILLNETGLFEKLLTNTKTSCLNRWKHVNLHLIVNSAVLSKPNKCTLRRSAMILWFTNSHDVRKKQFEKTGGSVPGTSTGCHVQAELESSLTMTSCWRECSWRHRVSSDVLRKWWRHCGDPRPRSVRRSQCVSRARLAPYRELYSVSSK